MTTFCLCTHRTLLAGSGGYIVRVPPYFLLVGAVRQVTRRERVRSRSCPLTSAVPADVVTFPVYEQPARAGQMRIHNPAQVDLFRNFCLPRQQLLAVSLLNWFNEQTETGLKLSYRDFYDLTFHADMMNICLSVNPVSCRFVTLWFLLPHCVPKVIWIPTS